jgi:hypothetical protein
MTGPKIEFTAGAIAVRDSVIGGFMTTTATPVPVHVCHFTCLDEQVSLDMAEALIAVGLDRSRIGRR